MGKGALQEVAFNGEILTSKPAANGKEAFAAAFEGCGGLKAADINKISFLSTADSKEQQLCLDDVKLEG